MDRIVEEDGFDELEGAGSGTEDADVGGRHGNEGKACVMTPAVRSISLLFTFVAAPRPPPSATPTAPLLVLRSARPSFLMFIRLSSFIR